MVSLVIRATALGSPLTYPPSYYGEPYRLSYQTPLRLIVAKFEVVVNPYSQVEVQDTRGVRYFMTPQTP